MRTLHKELKEWVSLRNAVKSKLRSIVTKAKRVQKVRLVLWLVFGTTRIRLSQTITHTHTHNTHTHTHTHTHTQAHTHTPNLSSDALRPTRQNWRTFRIGFTETPCLRQCFQTSGSCSWTDPTSVCLVCYSTAVGVTLYAWIHVRTHTHILTHIHTHTYTRNIHNSM